MAAAFAICPHCSKNITLESDVFDSYNCPLCDGPLTMELLRMKNSIIDMGEANISFETGKQYFDNSDFREAGIHFKKSLKFNANHYLSFYYAGLCDIYENEGNPEYDKILNLMRILKYSFLKLDSAQVDMQYKIPFILAAVKEVYALLLSEYNVLDTIFEKQNAPRVVRHRMMLLAKHINSFMSLEKDFLLIFHQDVAAAILQLVDLGIRACIKSTQTRAIDEKTISVPLDTDFDSASKIYNSLLYFANGLDSKYSIEQYRPDFLELGEFNLDVIEQIDKYNKARGSKDRAAFISVKGQILDYLKEQCKTAILYTYSMLFQNLYVKKGDAVRIEFLIQGIAFCYEILYPRISVNNKRVLFETPEYSVVQDVAPYLDAFLSELSDTSIKKATGSIDEFFSEINDMTGMYFETVFKVYSNKVNYLKMSKGNDFYYYSEFLVNIVFASCLALKDSIEFVPFNKSKHRMSLLKVGKQAAEEFLLLHDYKFVELEKNQIYAELIRIYNETMNALERKSIDYYG